MDRQLIVSLNEKGISEISIEPKLDLSKQEVAMLLVPLLRIFKDDTIAVEYALRTLFTMVKKNMTVEEFQMEVLRIMEVEQRKVKGSSRPCVPPRMVIPGPHNQIKH